MSKQAMWSTNDSTGKSRQTMQSYQPVWMAHWMRTSSNATTERHDVGAPGNKELDHTTRDDHITMEAVKDPGKIEANTKVFADKGMCSAQTNHGQDTGDNQAIRPIVDHNLCSGKDINSKCVIQSSSGVLAGNEESSRGYHPIIVGTSKESLELGSSHFSAKDRNSSIPMPLQERLCGHSTHIVPYHDLERYNKGKAVVCQSISKPSILFNNQLPDTKLKRIGQEDNQKPFGWVREFGNPSEPDASVNTCFGDRNTSLLLDASSIHVQPRSGQWLQKMHKCPPVISLLPSQSSEKNAQKVPFYDLHSLQKFPSCVHETMRICTTVDSVEAPPRGCPWFSQTTHSLLITEKTDVNVSKETGIFRRLITQMTGNSCSDLECGPPFFGQANGGLTLQPINSSNSEGQGNIGDIGIGTSKHATKNESSAETDTMDMDFLKEERPNFGENSTSSTKVFNFDDNLSPRIDVASSSKVGCRWTRSGLPAINLELPASPAAASSSEDVPTSSRTQSLEMDMLLAQAEQPEAKSNPSLDASPRADPTTRWVKLLRLNSTDSSAGGTKSLKLAEKLSHDKKRDFFGSIFKIGITGEQRGKETFLSDGSGNLPKEDEQPKKSKDLLLSHVWIKRWLRNGSQISQRKPETVVVCEPQIMKSSLDQKKQFPSIAAMALMGRSMSGLHSCELQKRGSFTTWKTNTL